MNFTDEIKGYSIDDLELIIATQKDLYTDDEMVQLKQQLINKRNEEASKKQKRIVRNLPDTIPCQKCGGPNPFDNTVCNYCGVSLNKRPYYIDPADLEDDLQSEQLKTEDRANDGYTFHYIVSFLIPLIGFITGAIMLANDEVNQRDCGKACIILAIISTIICTFFSLILL